jgi:hypothetical protein
MIWVMDFSGYPSWLDRDYENYIFVMLTQVNQVRLFFVIFLPWFVLLYLMSCELRCIICSILKKKNIFLFKFDLFTVIFYIFLSSWIKDSLFDPDASMTWVACFSFFFKTRLQQLNIIFCKKNSLVMQRSMGTKFNFYILVSIYKFRILSRISLIEQLSSISPINLITWF